MSKIHNKLNWQRKELDHTHTHNQDFNHAKEQMDQEDTTKQELKPAQTGLDMNLVVACFQEKLSQLTTELVVKEATIRQLTNIINLMKGDQ